MTQPLCPICGTAGVACGDSHMTRPPISSRSFSKGDDTMPEPAELKEYHYMVGHVEHSAMLTEKMATRLGAKPIGEPLDETNTGEVENNEAQRMSTASREADDAGVANAENEETAAKTRAARNKRASGV